MPVKQWDNQTRERRGRQACQLDVAERSPSFEVVVTQQMLLGTPLEARLIATRPHHTRNRVFFATMTRAKISPGTEVHEQQHD